MSLISRLREFFLQRSVPAFLVGGFVRDLLLEKEIKDIDITIQADALTLGRELAGTLGGAFVLLDEARGIARVVTKHQGRQWYIDLSSFAGDVLEDLARRDFTIDAMALPLEALELAERSNSLIDPFHGREDLHRGTIKAVGPGVFQEDPLRLLRAPRLAVQLGFNLEPDTYRGIQADSPLVNTVAPERLRDEFLKLLAQPGASTSLRLLDDLGLLCKIIPELSETKDVAQPKEHFWDVFHHSLETTGAVEKVTDPRSSPPDPVLDLVPRDPLPEGYFRQEASDGHTRLTMLKLAGLLHDIAKPATKTFEPSGRMRFFGHNQQGAVIAEGILKRLRFSGRGVAMVSDMVEHHLRPSQLNQPGQLPTQRAIYRYFRDLGDVAIDTLYLNLADFLAARGPDLEMEPWTEHCGNITYTLQVGLERGRPQVIPKLIDGREIMHIFNLSPGPQIGKLLELVKEAQGAGEISTREKAVSLVREHLQSGEDVA